MSDGLVKITLWLWRNQPFRPIALLLSHFDKSCYAQLIDYRAEEERSTKKAGWWWLSFSEPRRPKGQRFLGVAIVEAHGVASASLRAVELGINPGGEIHAVELKGDGVPAQEFRNRLLDMDHLKRSGLS